MDLISVIVPVYNAKKYLRECLDSIVAQTYKNIEILIVEDGSTDGSGEICDTYVSDDRVKVYHRRNSGLSVSRQFGIDRCKGKYFCTVDSDDYISCDFIERMVGRIVELDADIVVCGRIDFEDGKNNSVSHPVSNLYADKTENINKAKLEDHFTEYCSTFVLSDSWNKLYRTEFVRQSGVGFKLDRKFNGTDLLFNHSLIMHMPRYAILDANLLFHRNLGGSKVHRRNEYLQEGFEFIIEDLHSEASKLDIELGCALSERYFALMNLVYLNIIDFEQTKKTRRDALNVWLARSDTFCRNHKYIRLTSIHIKGFFNCLERYCLVNNRIYTLWIATDLYILVRCLSRTLRRRF